MTNSEWMGIFCIAGVVVLAYFIGNISPAILIGKLHGIDIKKEGSGNAGTTNVLRVLGKKAAAETLFVDIFKGVLAVFLGRMVGNYFLPTPSLAALLCCVAVLCGHIWPMAFGFRGGKGIATGFGAIITFSLPIGLGLLLIALLGILLSQRVSVGSLIATGSLPILSYLYEPHYVFPFAIMAAIVFYKHKANIQRLIRGEEPKISFKK